MVGRNKKYGTIALSDEEHKTIEQLANSQTENTVMSTMLKLLNRFFLSP